MHYYKRHIGDYHKKAGRLSILEHGAYTLLIDACYDRERFPTLEEAIDWVWASTDEEVRAVEFVLKRFFDLDENGVYIQSRIAEEIGKYEDICAKNKQIAEEREAKRKENNTKRARSVNETPPNHKPLTTNQEPLTNINNTPFGFDHFWSAYPRKTQKKNALKAWTKLKPDQGLLDLITKNISDRVESGEWAEKQFIPHPATYLNQERWTDEAVANENTQGHTNQHRDTRGLSAGDRVRAAAARRQAESGGQIVTPVGGDG